MPPKKKQKVTKPTSAASSSSKPSSSRSTRSRTRSASVAPSTSPSKKSTSKKRKLTRGVKAEPEDDLADKSVEELEAWNVDQLPQTECWVELPPMPEPKSKEDALMFVRPKSKKALREKGKHKEYKDSLVWHVDHVPADAEPFYLAEDDLREDDGGDASYVVAVRPRANKSKSQAENKSQEASTSAASNKDKQKSRESSLARQAKAAKAITSDTVHNVAEPNATRAATLLEAPSQIASSLPGEDGLEDMFLGSNDASSSSQRPLFFDDVSDQEDRLRNGTPVPSRERQRIKQSPTYGDRIAQGSSSYRARSSTPRATTSDAQPRSRKEKESSGDKGKGKEKAKDREVTLKSSNKESKKRARSVESDSEPKGKKKSDDTKDLRSDLNEDAFVRSTGARHKEEYRNKLAAFAQARKKALQERGESVSSGSDDQEVEQQAATTQRKLLGQNRRAATVSSDSDSSDSDSSDSDSSSSSSSEDSQDFIVADDQVEYDEGFGPEDEEEASPYVVIPSRSQTRDLSAKGRFDRDKDGRIRLVPLSEHAAAASSSSSILAAHGLGAGSRKGLDELCLDWMEWAAARVLLTWPLLCQSDRERLERNRAALRSRMRSIEESVGSVSMRRQFRWYLLQYPRMEVEALFSDELDRYGTLAKNGCGVCHRKSQKAQFKIMLHGERYNQEWLSPLKKQDDDSDTDPDSSSDSDASDTSSDRSSDGETWVEQGTPDHRGRPTFVFFAGQHCAQRAAVLHKLHHWELHTMQTLAKHDSIKFIRRLLWRKKKMGRGKDGHMGCGAWEVWLAVNEMISLSGRCTWPSKTKGTKGSELERLRRRLKSLSEQAIEVNRAR